MHEKRRFIRLDAILEATIRTVDAESDAIFSALTRNVSGGGVALTTQNRLKVGTALEVSVKFPERTQPVRFTAAVVWSDPETGPEPKQYESGLRFMEIGKPDQEFIIQRAQRAA